MNIYIKSDSDGLFIGEFQGHLYFDSSFLDSPKGDGSVLEKPVKFESVEQARKVIDSWPNGPYDCYVFID
jgi:hypothetical protein